MSEMNTNSRRVRAASLSLDFDLAAAQGVDLAQFPPVVTARPYIVAEIEPHIAVRFGR
jgi:hypothetical protein